MVGDQLNLVEVSVEKDAGGNPTCIICPMGEGLPSRVAVRRSCARPVPRAGSRMSAMSMSSVAGTGRTAGRLSPTAASGMSSA